VERRREKRKNRTKMERRLKGTGCTGCDGYGQKRGQRFVRTNQCRNVRTEVDEREWSERS
jgi:hypothetical protein